MRNESTRPSTLREKLRPLDRERPGRGDLRRIETTILVLLGLFLAIATIDDTARKVHVNQRLIADLATWRTRTGHHYHNLAVEQNLNGVGTREVVCGNTTPGSPGSRVQICLVITGPIAHGLRGTHGGYYLPPHVPDLPRYRYGCFGSALSAGECEPTAGPPADSLEYQGE